MKEEIPRTGVLIGGPSREREISLKSGKAVYEALSAEGLDVVLIEIPSRFTEEEIRALITEAKVSVAFIALHGEFGEDGKLQALLDDSGIQYTGSGPEPSRWAMDKVISRQKFHAAGLGVPRGTILKKGEGISQVKLKYPAVVKPHNQGSSIGQAIIQGPKELTDACREAFSLSDKIIIEEYINGRELTVGIMDDAALPVIEIIPERRFYDYEAKYNHPGTRYEVPAKLSDSETGKAQEAGLLAHHALGLEIFSRIDMILDVAGNIFVLEANSIPGLTKRSLLPKAALSAGIDFAALCRLIISSSLRRKYGKTIRSENQPPPKKEKEPQAR